MLINNKEISVVEMKEFRSKLKIIVAMKFDRSRKDDYIKYRSDFFRRFIGNDVEETIFVWTIFNELEPNTLEYFLDEQLGGINRNTFYKIRNRLQRELYIAYSGKYKIVEVK